MTISHYKFPIGNSDFTDIILKGATYVDKTLFIKEIMDDFSKVILITRPRRFGKTLGLSMLQAFFDRNGPDIFEGLNIAKETDFCCKNQNKYPVISMTFKDVKADSFEGAMLRLRSEFAAVYRKHKYVLNGDILSLAQKLEFEAICDKKKDVDLNDALKDLIAYIHEVTGIKPILLIDEYDTPIHSAYLNDFYDDMVLFLRGILSGALKDNVSLEKAVMTGILRIAKESMFSGLNNLSVHTVMNKEYASYFGFTGEEVESLLDIHCKSEKNSNSDKDRLVESVKDWYNGYHIGNTQVYNPWSIIRCLSNNLELESYWLNTSDNALVYDLINKSSDDVKNTMENLIKGIPQIQTIQEDLTFRGLETNSAALWTFLLHGGYLNVISQGLDDRGRKKYTIKIPNKEVLSIYEDIVEHWFDINYNNAQYLEFLKSLESDDPSKFFAYIGLYMKSSMSFFDLDKKTPEQVFHVFMMGLLVGFRHKYDITSNKEAGDGRYDVFMRPLNSDQKAILIEFKTCPNKESLQEMADLALRQISDKQYISVYCGKVLCIGLAFWKKDIAHAYSIKGL